MDQKLATPSSLKEEGRREIAESLNILVADTFALYFKTKNFHWHVTGPHFSDYHRLFDEQGEQIFAMIDPLAERVRKLGFPTLHSIGEVSRLKRIADNDTLFIDAHKMIALLLEDHKMYVDILRKTRAIAEKYNDNATCSILEVYIDEGERRIWFLYASLP